MEKQQHSSEGSIRPLLVVLSGLAAFFALVLFVWNISVATNWWWTVIMGGALTGLFLLSKLVFSPFYSLRNYLPGFWTSLGILGTFMTIFYQLQDGKVSAVISGDAQAASQFLTDFGSAFSTSIVGIIGSIVSKILINAADELDEAEKRSERSYLNEMVLMLNQQVQKMDNMPTRESIEMQLQSLGELFSKMPTKTDTENLRKSLEKIASDQNKAMNSLIEAQNAKIEQFSASIGGVITTIDGHMQQLVKSITDTIAPQIKQLSEGMFKELEEVMQKLAEEANKNLQNSYQQFLAGAKQSMEEQNTLLANAAAKQTANIEEQQKQMKEQANNLQKVLGDNKDSVATATEAIAKTVLGLETTINQTLENLQREAINQLKETQTQANEMLTVQKTQEEALQAKSREQLEELKNIAAEQIANLQETFQGAVGAYAKEIREVLDTVQNWQAANKVMVESATTKFDQAVNAYGQNILVQKDLDEQLRSRIGSLIEQKDQLAKFEHAATNLHEQLKTQNADLLNKWERIAAVFENSNS